jgi:membrane-associated phospholipid phosphatase
MKKYKQTMKNKCLCLIRQVLLPTVLWLGFANHLPADVITDWNGIAIPYIRTAPNITATRQLAMVHVAQFEAVNAVVGKYTPYLVNIAAPTASPEAAAAQAAHDILLRFYPASQTALDASLATSLAAVSDGPAKTDGITLGAAVAAQIWTLRASDGTTLTVSNAFPGGPGLWSPTPGGPSSPVSQQYAYATPWTLRCASQFRPGPPPSLASAQWATDFNEIKSLGSTNSATRTPDQTDIGLFIIEFPFFLLNDALKQALAANPMSLVDTARAFALMHMASADAGIAVWDAKYAYNFWRPVTAIRAADTDGNDATAPDVTWLPLRPTPGHPEYPCAHCTASAAMTTVLAALFGDNFTFTLESPTLPGKPRTFHKFSEYAALALDGRLYAGFHYRNSSVVGLDLGAKVGDYVMKNFLTSGPTLAGQLQNGEFRLTTRNVGTLQQRIETSSDLVNWTTLTNYTSADLLLQILDPDAANTAHKFYRAVSQ